MSRRSLLRWPGRSKDRTREWMVRKVGENLGGKRGRKNVMKDIILQLHKGLSPQQAKERFVKEVGSVTSSEIAEMEQALINEGLSTDEIKKFCNVHVLLFENALQA